MLPLGHAAVAYLWYVGYAAVRTRRLPVRGALIPLAIGSQFPDLIDKPLAYVDLLAYGRSLAHSLFTFGLVTAVVWLLVRRMAKRWEPTGWRDRNRVVTPAAFAIGYLSHLVGDSYQAILSGDFYRARFLVYPLYPLSESPADETPPWIRLIRIYEDMENHPQVELILLAIAVFLALQLRQYWQRHSLG